MSHAWQDPAKITCVELHRNVVFGCTVDATLSRRSKRSRHDLFIKSRAHTHIYKRPFYGARSRAPEHGKGLCTQQLLDQVFNIRDTLGLHRKVLEKVALTRKHSGEVHYLG